MSAVLVSYPKSGRTWLRHMLGACGHGKAIAFTHDGFEFNDGTRPPHDFNLDKRLTQYSPAAKVIYLDRDPRDVMVSLFHQVTGRFRDFFDYRGSIDDFIRDDYFGACVLRDFRAMWSEILARRPFLCVSYEQLHDDPSEVLGRVLDYCGLASTTSAIALAVEASRFAPMKQVEESGAFPEPWLRPRNGFPKMRVGAKGGFRVLAPNDVAHLNEVFGLR